MIMKKFVMTMVALLTMTAAVAQDANKEKKAPKAPTAQEMTDRMAQDLNLTSEQKTKVLALNNEYKDVLRGPGMRRGRGPRPDGQTGATAQQQDQQKKQQRPERPQLTDEQKAQMKANMEKRKEYDTKLKQILTDEQYQKFQKQHQRRGGRGGQGGRRPERRAGE